MCDLNRSLSSYRSALRLCALAAVVSTAVPMHIAAAQGTHLWTQSRLEEFEKGTPQGVALTSDGHLREAPLWTETLTTPSTYVWSVAADQNGNAYLGTAAPATVLRVGPDGKPFTLFETKDLSVQTVRLGPDGSLYAATLPSGKVYRLQPGAAAKQDDASATAVFDLAKIEAAKSADNKTGENSSAPPHYVWDMTFDAAGRLYIATGGPGAVYRVDPAQAGNRPELFFKSDEQHIRSLAWDAKGNLIAGSDGSGLVYRIDPLGKGYVLFEAPRREITAVCVAANGTVYAASVGDKSRNPLPSLPVQGTGSGSMSFTVTSPGSLQAANTSASLPEGSDIYALAEGQAPRKLWSGKDEIVYALAARPNGLLALTGNRGRIFQIQDDGSYADVAHLQAQQGLSLAAIPEASGQRAALLVGTGNTGKLVRLDTAAGKHEYASDVLDAGALARFGRVEVQPDATGYEIWTRSGNVEQPVRGWSEWTPLKDGAVASPAGRFLQWKAVLHAGGELGGVGVNYLAVNAAPVVDELAVVPGARLGPQNSPSGQPQTVNIGFSTPSQSASYDAGSNSPLQAAKDRTAISVRWAAHDDNGDDLTFALYLRGDGETVWRLLKDGLTDKAYSFDAALIPDGGYRIKVVASDAPSHTPGDALTGAKTSERFEVDTTPPVVGGLEVSATGRVVFEAEDASSPIARAEYALDAGSWQFIEPLGGLSDSKRERYELQLPAAALKEKGAEHLLTVRVYDRHDNIGLAKAVFTTPAQ
jgi:hypothetical protein